MMSGISRGASHRNRDHYGHPMSLVQTLALGATLPLRLGVALTRVPLRGPAEGIDS